jgi:acetate kinase
VNVLCINAGSSSLRFAVRHGDGTPPLFWGEVDGIGQPDARSWVRSTTQDVKDESRHRGMTHAAAIEQVLTALDERAVPLTAVGHRIVHGGRRFTSATRIDAGVIAELRTLVPLAPLHLPAQLMAIGQVTAQDPTLPQVACFDTAFHRRMPELAHRLPLPEWAWDEGIMRFGFHGLSYEHVVDALGPRSGRVVIAHLGNGASMAAVHDGIPLDTSMAFTPSGGLMMGTRCGDLDPGVFGHLFRQRGMTADQIDHMVTHESGLLGVSGTTSDMHTLLGTRDHDARADRAVAMFCRTAGKAIGALVTVLDGIDQLVFTGGIGEHAAEVRAEICVSLAHLGVVLDTTRNDADAAEIGADGAPCRVRIIAADETRVVARQTCAVVEDMCLPGVR